jgi:DNA-damage-inducible protein D
MDKQKISTLKQQFDAHVYRVEDTAIEFCYARELMLVLGYDRWENFQNAIEKAQKSFKNINISIENHFRDVTKMVNIFALPIRKQDQLL